MNSVKISENVFDKSLCERGGGWRSQSIHFRVIFFVEDLGWQFSLNNRFGLKTFKLWLSKFPPPPARVFNVCIKRCIRVALTAAFSRCSAHCHLGGWWWVWRAGWCPRRLLVVAAVPPPLLPRPGCSAAAVSLRASLYHTPCGKIRFRHK